MSDLKPYHHGDLRQSLLAAGEVELAINGIEAFSLRQVAKRAGVSHAAPAHHFGDANGLLTALAAEGFRLFLKTQNARETKAAPDPRSQMIAAGLGYVDFALARPALFGLLFGSTRANFTDPDLYQAAEAAYLHLCDQVTAVGGQGPSDVAAIWSTAHGLAALMAAGRLKHMLTMTPSDRDKALSAIVERVLPPNPSGA